MGSTKFTAHNIRLDDGTYTIPDEQYSIDKLPWFISARRILNIAFPENKNSYRLADLGCLEGGYAVEFARMGFQVVGIDIRDANIAACNYVKSKTNLSNLTFVKDNALNIEKYGLFDAIFCSGLLYHLDNPKEFLRILSAVTKKVLILNTHFSTTDQGKVWPDIIRKLLMMMKKSVSSVTKFSLSRLTDNENLRGRWYIEYPNDAAFRNREKSRKASWDNRRSFWIQREYLLQTIYDVGFDLVLEQFDIFAPNIAEDILKGYYRINSRGVFIGIKTPPAEVEHSQPEKSDLVFLSPTQQSLQ